MSAIDTVIICVKSINKSFFIQGLTFIGLMAYLWVPLSSCVVGDWQAIDVQLPRENVGQCLAILAISDIVFYTSTNGMSQFFSPHDSGGGIANKTRTSSSQQGHKDMTT